jgi:uncharacterized phage protein (TIGR02218 family)
MKNLSPAFQAHLDTGATTLCWCWRIMRRDGQILGFTDHDRDLTFDGTSFEASAGFTASEIKDGVGLSVDNLSIEGALSSTHLSDHDLAAGLYDDAKIQVWRVSWSDTTQHALMRTGSIGEVRRSGLAFSAEIRGLTHYLQQPQGRVYQFTCDATLGDTRCGIDLTSATYRATASVASTQNQRQVTVTGIEAYASDWFTRGLCRITSGGNTGSVIEIKRHQTHGASATLELWQPLSNVPAIGDTLVLTAGCDKHFATCRERFDNSANFRGLPHMPGNDFLTIIARPGDATNNGSIIVS